MPPRLPTGVSLTILEEKGKRGRTDAGSTDARDGSADDDEVDGPARNMSGLGAGKRCERDRPGDAAEERAELEEEDGA